MSEPNDTSTDSGALPNAGRDSWTQSPEQAAASATAAAKASVKNGKDSGDGNWERDLIARVAFASISEQRRARRWGIFFKLLGFSYFGVVLFMASPWHEEGVGGIRGMHTAMVEVDGVISAGDRANADTIVSGLRAAFEDDKAKGIILRINSPGGSPVQAGYVNDEIKRLKAKYPEKKVYAVIADICASGGYYIAVAADKIYADKASIVGSIGVLMDGFGFVGTMEKLGVERRLLTSGEHKGFLDPFSPMKTADADHMRKLLTQTHEQFIKVVKDGRGDRLKDVPELFSGFVWSGAQGVEIGLVDGLGSAGYVAREVIGAEKIIDYTLHPSPFQRWAEKIGATFGHGVLTAFGVTPNQIR